MPSAIVWRVHYIDGTSLNQFDVDGKEHSYTEIDRPRLQAFDLWWQGRLLVRVDLRDDTKGNPDIGRRRLIWRIRHIARSNGEHIRIHLAGWQRNIKGVNVQAIAYAFEDGWLVLGGQFTDTDFMDTAYPLPWETDLKD